MAAQIRQAASGCRQPLSLRGIILSDREPALPKAVRAGGAVAGSGAPPREWQWVPPRARPPDSSGYQSRCPSRDPPPRRRCTSPGRRLFISRGPPGGPRWHWLQRISRGWSLHAGGTTSRRDTRMRPPIHSKAGKGGAGVPRSPPPTSVSQIPPGEHCSPTRQSPPLPESSARAFLGLSRTGSRGVAAGANGHVGPGRWSGHLGGPPRGGKT